MSTPTAAKPSRVRGQRKPSQKKEEASPVDASVHSSEKDEVVDVEKKEDVPPSAEVQKKPPVRQAARPSVKPDVKPVEQELPPVEPVVEPVVVARKILDFAETEREIIPAPVLPPQKPVEPTQDETGVSMGEGPSEEEEVPVLLDSEPSPEASEEEEKEISSAVFQFIGPRSDVKCGISFVRPGAQKPVHGAEKVRRFMADPSYIMVKKL